MFTRTHVNTNYILKPIFACAAGLAALAAIGLAAGSAMAGTYHSAASDAWVAKAEQHISDNLTYPRFALRKNDQGITHLKLTPGSDGSFSNAVIQRSSGSRDLDREAMRVTKTLEPLSADMPGVGSVLVRIGFAIAGSESEAAKIRAKFQDMRDVRVEVLDIGASK